MDAMPIKIFFIITIYSFSSLTENFSGKIKNPKPIVPGWDWRLSNWTDLFDEYTYSEL